MAKLEFQSSLFGISVKTNLRREIVNVNRGHRIDLQHTGVTRKYNVSTRQGIKSSHGKLSYLLSEKHRRKIVKYCEQSPRGGGAQGTSHINGYRPSNLIKKSDIVLSVQNSPPKNKP